MDKAKTNKVWKVSKLSDPTVYNARLAKKLRKLSMRALRIAQRHGVTYVDLTVVGEYASARAKVDNVTSATTVVDDYIFTVEE